MVQLRQTTRRYGPFQSKDYVLTLLFMKYRFDEYAGDPYGMILVSESGSFRDRVAKLITMRTRLV